MTTDNQALFSKLSALAVASNQPEWSARFHDAQFLDVYHPDLWAVAKRLAVDDSDAELTDWVVGAQQHFETRMKTLGWSLGAHQWSAPVAEVDQGDDGLFIDILYGKNGSPLRQGDKLYLHPYHYRSAEDLLAADKANAFDYPEHSLAWHFFKRVEGYVADKIESQIEHSFESWWESSGQQLVSHELSVQDLMTASWRAGVLKGEQGLARVQSELEQAKKQIQLMEKALLDVRRNSEDVSAAGKATDALHNASLIPINLLAVPKPAFTVSIEKMTESHRETYWVVLENRNRQSDAKPWDSEGRITPMYSVHHENALESAMKWARFLGTEVVQAEESTNE